MKQLIKNIFRAFGFDITRRRPISGVDPLDDIGYFLKGIDGPVILDVGANIGQSAQRFKRRFPGSRIHCFEPDPRSYRRLQKRVGGTAGVSTWNCGVGSAAGRLPFNRNDVSAMSSFLKLSGTGWGRVSGVVDVDVVTLDGFCTDRDIGRIDLLKADTQGFNLEVFKGAERLMRENRISLIYFEVIFSDMYKDLPSYDTIFNFLLRRNFSLVTFYKPHFQENLLGWTDALFVSTEYNRELVRQGRVVSEGTGLAGGHLRA